MALLAEDQLTPRPGPDPQPFFLERLQREIDAHLARGTPLPVLVWKSAWPEEARAIDELVELRVALHGEGLLGPDPDLPLEEIAQVDRTEVARERGQSVRGRPSDQAPSIPPHAWDAEVEETLKLEAWIADALALDSGRPSPLPDRDTGIGRFHLCGRLGSHPVGAFFRAEERETRKPVHLLVVRPDVPTDQARALLREVEAVRGVRLPGFAEILALGEERGVRYVAWEMPSGRPLDGILADLESGEGVDGLAEILLSGGELAKLRSEERPRHVPPRREEIVARLSANPAHQEMVRRVTVNLATVLLGAHEQGQVHLDLAPQHIFLAEDGSVTLAAFGLGRHQRGFLLDRGHLPVFRAPELFLNDEHPKDWRADLFGIGAILFASIRLEAPVLLAADSRLRTEVQESFAARLAERVHQVEGPFRGVLHGLLAYDPADRPQTCVELLRSLDALWHSAPVRAAPPIRCVDRVRRWLLRSFRRSTPQ